MQKRFRAQGDSFFGKPIPGMYTAMLTHVSHARLPMCTHSTAMHGWEPPGEAKTLQGCPSHSEAFLMPKGMLTAWIRLRISLPAQATSEMC